MKNTYPVYIFLLYSKLIQPAPDPLNIDKILKLFFSFLLLPEREANNQTFSNNTISLALALSLCPSAKTR